MAWAWKQWGPVRSSLLACGPSEWRCLEGSWKSGLEPGARCGLEIRHSVRLAPPRGGSVCPSCPSGSLCANVLGARDSVMNVS